MYRDFSKYIANDEDRTTFRKWVYGLGIFYGVAGLLMFGFVAVHSYETEVPQKTAVTATAATAIAVNSNRAH